MVCPSHRSLPMSLGTSDFLGSGNLKTPSILYLTSDSPLYAFSFRELLYCKARSPSKFHSEPGASVGPPGVGGAGRHAENLGALGERQAAEVPQLHELGEFGLLDRQP